MRKLKPYDVSRAFWLLYTIFLFYWLVTYVHRPLSDDMADRRVHAPFTWWGVRLVQDLWYDFFAPGWPWLLGYCVVMVALLSRDVARHGEHFGEHIDPL